MASIMTIRLNKSPGSSWGFRLQGGKDFATPLCIQKVNVGSVAAQAGLQAGDAIVSIGGSDALSMRHKEAQDAIVRAGNNFELVVQRGSQIWKPTVTALPETKVLPDGVPVATKTSLAANQKTYRPIGSGHNTSAAPYQLVNAQYNSPVNIYSEDSIAETLSAQAEVLGKGVLGINFKKYAREEKIRTDSPTYKLLHGEEEERKPRPVSMHNVTDSIPFQRDVTQDHKATPPPQNYPSGQSAAGAPSSTLQPGENICYGCQTLITGVFVRIKNKNLHADCFKCATCGSSLKNVGYYNINDKLYCDIHAKQAARSNPPAPNLEPIIVQPGAAPPPGALTAPQASRMKIPSAFQQGGPAVAPAPVPAPAPFKPPSGGIKLLPVSSSALSGPTPYKPPQTEVQQPEPQDLPEPLPAPVFEPIQIPLAVNEVISQSQLSSQIVENEGVVLPPPTFNGGTFASQEEELLPPQETFEKELKFIQNGYVEDIQTIKEKEATPETLLPNANEDTSAKEVVTSTQKGIPEIHSDDNEKMKELESETNQKDSINVEQVEIANNILEENLEVTMETPMQSEPSPIIQNGHDEEHPQEYKQNFLLESSQEGLQKLTKETVQTHIQENIQEVSQEQSAQTIQVDHEPFPLKPSGVDIVPESKMQQIPEPEVISFNLTDPSSILKDTQTKLPASSNVVNITPAILNDGTINSISHFQSEESHITESKFSSSVVQMSVGSDTASQRAPAPAPAPIKPFAPAPAPAPASVAAVPVKPVSYSTSANPQGFGAPAGDINIRAHIPKKGQRFEWPPSRTTPVVEEEPHPPAWAPAGEIPSVRRPVKPAGPLPKRPPLLPTPPPPKDYDVIVMKSLSSTQLQSVQETVHQTVKQSVQESMQKTVQHTTYQSSQSQSRSVPSPKPLPQQAPPPPAASRFPKPAPALINLTSVSSSSTSKTSHAASSKSTPKPKSTGPVSVTTSAIPKKAVNVSSKKISISPPKSVPLTTPMPSVKFDSVPKTSDSKPLFPQPSAVPSSLPQQKQQQQQQHHHQQQQSKKHHETAITGFKSVSAPSHKQNLSIDGGYKTVKTSELTSVETSFVKSNLPASAPALSENVVPKPVPSTPPAPAGDVPASMTFAPAPAPAPIPSFGSNSMPKPMPPPGIGGKIGPGGPPARGVLQAPGHRSAPRRGRGVMNQASASRIPVCNACQRQIRGPFVSALGKTWCPDHFICATPTCKRNIIDMGFVEEKGLLYCENCYESYLAPICGKCDKRIKGDCLNAVGKQFHPECFCCAYCGKVFGSGAFYLEDGLPYCETDWNDLFTTKCVGCNFPIEAGDRWVEALNNNYHSQCFKCSKCHKNLEGQSFFAKGGKPFCKAHAQRGF